MQRDHHDLWGGLTLAAAGLGVAVWSGVHYDFGALRAMGPGFFPTILGALLAVLGLLVAIPAWTRAGVPSPIHWPEALAVLGAIVLFGFGMHRLGLVLTTALAVLLASWPAERPGWVWRLALCAAVTALVWLVFGVGLKMSIPLWPQLSRLGIG
ncbi:tripartite tricarboxylate transporter TctB family protein [Paracoccus sp. Z118]|uniref:tripartite tricarboxylate transporter TctB family protein n=1 Tax=Paracoccus sp. Z118 TaxID=2851017 RepID=UPI001C2BBC74|nr:tripartite tricarboxylate transporter TctB family protein [Paracoccus sp. Z118]MBV0891075.1 tripartite tricarboxylate transporter TctB family protein [Paracoccus sp. Z118]